MDTQMNFFFGLLRFSHINPTYAGPVVYSCGKKSFFAEGA
jgi:hypothetical protein